MSRSVPLVLQRGARQLLLIITKALAKETRKSTEVIHSRSTYFSFVHPSAWTCVDFGRAQIYTQVDASFSPFGHPMQVDTSRSQVHCIYVKFTAFYDLRELASRLANPFGHPSQGRMQVLVCKLALTCIDLRVRLASGFM